MLVKNIWCVLFVSASYSFPSRSKKNVVDNNIFDNFDNYLPKYDEIPGFGFNSIENSNARPKENVDSHIQSIAIKNKTSEASETREKVMNIASNAAISTSTLKPPTKNKNVGIATSNKTSITSPLLQAIVSGNSTKYNNESKRKAKQQEFEEESKEKESQEDDSSSSEEEPNMVTGLLAAFLGGLSRPDGSIDLEAILGLLGSLSTQNPDGTYDFTGLTDLLKGFFGGGGEGGSDVAAFAGGLLGAVIKGLSPPPGGAKGAGLFTGRLLGGILPALSGPPDDGGDMPPMKEPPLDSGGFVSGVIKAVFQSSAGNVSKYGLIKSVIGLITSLSKTASSLSFGKPTDWNQQPPPPPPAK